jgi:hypothetical protein
MKFGLYKTGQTREWDWTYEPDQKPTGDDPFHAPAFISHNHKFATFSEINLGKNLLLTQLIDNPGAQIGPIFYNKGDPTPSSLLTDRMAITVTQFYLIDALLTGFIDNILGNYGPIYNLSDSQPSKNG